MNSIEALTDRPTSDRSVNGVMKALVYHGAGERAWETNPSRRFVSAAMPSFEVTTSTICGTDLHTLKGDVPSVTRDGKTDLGLSTRRDHLLAG